jgi:class 3 adenylate cyclase
LALRCRVEVGVGYCGSSNGATTPALGWCPTFVLVLLCPRCGHENPPAANFCLKCGAALADGSRDARAIRQERKVVTVLFADLVGFTSRAERLDPEDVHRFLSRYQARVKGELERFGGVMEKFIGDAVMALFGATTAHEDDPERAVRAALAIREWAKGEPDLHVRIGITTGEALVSLGARPEAGEGMASGDVVNTAARLQSAAPVDGILVDETTYRSTHRVVGYAESEPVEAKGKAAPVPVWQAREARARVHVERIGGARLIGREREVALVRAALARARDEREPQLVTLVGVPGIGKSRVVYELFKLVEQGPDLVYWRHGRSLPYGEGVSFWALGEMVKAQAGILESDGTEEADAKLARAVDALVPETNEARWVVGHLRPLVGLEAAVEFQGDRRDEAFAAWRRFLEALCEQRPMVTVFEDLHWADDGLLDFVDHLADWASGVPLLLLCTARPELLARRPGWGGGKPNALTISLSALSDEETARLLHELLNRRLLDAEVQAALVARAGGNPLYAEEFSRLVEERGTTHAGAAALPETVQGLIAARLDTLDSVEKSLLQDA